MTASYDRKGGRVYVGNSKGMIGVLDSVTLETLTSFRITTGANTPTVLRSIEFARRGDHFLVNSSDRIIRVFDSDDVLRSRKEKREPECIQRLQDLVNRTQWKKCCFSGDGEYIVAGSSRQHALNIWDKASGSLVKILQGMKGEILLDVVWHPVRPIIASVSSGVVSIWSHNQVENWSAFAPDFTELEENKEYDEHESEFDIEDEDKSIENMSDQEAEDEEIDVVTVGAVPALLSSEDESDEGLSYLPIAPEVDEPEETGMGQLDPDIDNRSAVNTSVPSAPIEGSESTSSPKKKTRTVLISVDGCDPAQMETSIQPVKARASATRSKGKQPKPRHSRRSQTKVKKRSQQRPVDDEISDIIEQIQAEVPIAIVGNKAITFESEAGINQTTEAVDIVCNNAATENINIDATEAGGQERVDRQTCEFEPLIPVVKQPDIKPDEKFIPTLQHVYDCHGERGDGEEYQ
jgi:COMPASS component SWD1